MAKLYTPLFTAHLICSRDFLDNKKQPGKTQGITPGISPKTFPKIHPDKVPLFEGQRQFLNFIEQLGLFRPCPETLNNILNYATGKGKGGPAAQQKDDNNYDPQATLSGCN